MPRRFRLPAEVMRRTFAAWGVLLPFFIYGAFRVFPPTRPTILAVEAELSALTTRVGLALRFLRDGESWIHEIPQATYGEIGPRKLYPVEVLTRAYGGKMYDVSVWNREGGVFVVGEPLIVENVLVGTVVQTAGDVAVVRTTLSHESLLLATVFGKEYIQGVLEGTDGAWMQFSYIPKGSPLVPGDVVITSGTQTGLPFGLSLGTVREVLDTDPSPFYIVRVEPFLPPHAWTQADVLHDIVL